MIYNYSIILFQLTRYNNMMNVLMVTKYKKYSLPLRRVLYYIIPYNINIIIDTRGK